jgi:hypothetical protein
MKKSLIVAAILSTLTSAAGAQGFADSDFQYITTGITVSKTDTYSIPVAGGLLAGVPGAGGMIGNTPLEATGSQTSAAPSLKAGLGWEAGHVGGMGGLSLVAELGITQVGSQMVVQPSAGWMLDTSTNTSLLAHGGWSNEGGLGIGADFLYHFHPKHSLRVGTTIFQKRIDGAKGLVEVSLLHPF